MSAGKLWDIRAGEPGDMGGLAFLWLESYSRSRYGRQFRCDDPKCNRCSVNHAASDRAASRCSGKELYWARHEPVVQRLLAASDVRIACDAQAPAVIWAFAIVDGDAVHYVLAKRRFHREEISADMFRDLLGDRLERRCFYTHELVEFRRHEVRARLALPGSWLEDPFCINRKAA